MNEVGRLKAEVNVGALDSLPKLVPLPLASYLLVLTSYNNIIGDSGKLREVGLVERIVHC